MSSTTKTSAPTPKKTSETNGVSKRDVLMLILMFSLISAAVWYAKKEPAEIKTEVTIIQSDLVKIDGDVNTTSEILLLQKLLVKELPEMGLSDNDLVKLTKVLMEPGALLDMSNLQWALNVLDKLPREVKERLKSRICADIPTLCNSSMSKNNVKVPEEIDSDDILNLDLTPRAYNALVNGAMIKKISTLVAIYEQQGKDVVLFKRELLKYRTVGLLTADQVVEELKEKGYIPKDK